MKRDEIESLIANPQDADRAETAARIYADSTLWPEFESSLYPDAEPTEEERRTIRRIVSERCGEASRRRQAWLRDFVAARLDRISGGMRDFALAAARKGENLPEGGAGPAAGAKRRDAAAEPVTFVFVSEPSDGLSGKSFPWRAEMTLPADAAVDEMLPIDITVGDGVPAAGGVFKVAGVALPVVRGRAEIPYGMFLSGLKDANVEFTDARGVRSHGTLALF